jgi:hypothetical protein
MAFHRARLAGLLYGADPRLAVELAAAVPLLRAGAQEEGGIAPAAGALPPVHPPPPPSARHHHPIIFRPPAAALAPRPGCVVPFMTPTAAIACLALSWGLPGEGGGDGGGGGGGVVVVEVEVAGGGLDLCRAARFALDGGGASLPASLLSAPPCPDPASTYELARSQWPDRPPRARAAGLWGLWRAAAAAAAGGGEGGGLRADAPGGRLLLRAAVPASALSPPPTGATLTLFSDFQPGGVRVAVRLLGGVVAEERGGGGELF